MYRNIENGKTLTEKLINPIKEKVFSTSLNEVDNATKWYEEICRAVISCDEDKIYKATLVFSELFINAYEHGNLKIDIKTKKHYLENDNYIEKLYEIEQNSHAKISVKIYKISKNGIAYMATQICDEGDGFDVFGFIKNGKSITNPNGRGIFVSHKNCADIYYNDTGNCVLFLNQIKI